MISRRPSQKKNRKVFILLFIPTYCIQVSQGERQMVALTPKQLGVDLPLMPVFILSHLYSCLFNLKAEFDSYLFKLALQVPTSGRRK